MYSCCVSIPITMHTIFVYNCRYDPQKSSWEPSKGMTTLRSRVGVAVVDRKLYAFGGYDGSSRLFTVECFDPEVGLSYDNLQWLMCMCIYACACMVCR